ncbi:hypothetical protein PGT21_014955 [Puccinia graminis f. sp. tritici]|uniref:Association with the SNF1 complex (ASC) domain-containing protein n=1 Tax=Puccinia graminis f. sp. tritici TaxID=56615 RepID=A0A5B0LPI2_PUCGR|nr:hypothetical protein PGTUg99_017934 [Puccinia graminis f. sp. tritici]KAA1090829.1 hypothetical protein PGT21_014955 [Puccinia graminis f. sp. tritici]
MGNSTSNQQLHHHHHHHHHHQQQQHSSSSSTSTSNRKHTRPTAAASLSSFTSQLKQQHHQHQQHQQPSQKQQSTEQQQQQQQQQQSVRRRKSLELPDLTTTASQLQTSSHHLSNFQLKLPSITSRSSSPLTTSQPLSSSPLSTTLDSLKLDSTHHPSTNIRSTPPDLHQQVGVTLPASPTPIQPDSDPIIHSKHGSQQQQSPLLSSILPSNSPIISSAPLQQPVETVVPPLPPAIIQPLPSPLPSLDADSAELPACPSAAFTTAVTETVAAATAVVQAAPALDIGAGPEGVPTLLTWKEPANEVYVTGTFSKWRQQIKLRKPVIPNTSTQQDAFSALVALPPGPHQLKFIVDRRWKTSKYLPSATDDKGNLINYLQVNPGDQPFRGLGPRGIWSGYTYADWPMGASILEDGSSERTDSEDGWTTEIPAALLDYEEYHDRSSADEQEQEQPSERISSQNPEQTAHSEDPTPGQAGFAAEPPKLPAQLKEGILNLSSRLPEGSSDDNSLLPRPDHSVLNHLAASPIRQGLLSVGVTSRFKRKYLTTVYYKPVDL